MKILLVGKKIKDAVDALKKEKALSLSALDFFTLLASLFCFPKILARRLI